MPPFCILAGNTLDGIGSLEMNGTSVVSNGTRPSPINLSHRSFGNFPEFFSKWKTPLYLIIATEVFFKYSAENITLFEVRNH